VTLDHLITYFGRWNLRVDDDIAREIMARAERFYRHVDGAVMAQHRAGAIATDQTTLTATFGAGHDLFFAHVGHSRAYLYRGDKLLRLTRDHTIGEQQSAGSRAPLIDVNAGARDLAHILTDTIGMSGRAGPSVDIERLTVDNDDRVLVCTNGLTDAVDEADLARILGSSGTPDDMSHALVELAASRGADDDATAVVAHYHFPS
jgi:protein phosphatase